MPEYLAGFLDKFVAEPATRQRIAERVFGGYDRWLQLLGDPTKRLVLESLMHEQAANDPVFEEVREISTEFAKRLELLFFNRDREQETNKIAALSLEYIGF